MLKRFLLLLVVAAIAAVPAVSTSGGPVAQDAGPLFINFDFDDPKDINAIGFFVDSELEPIRGFISGVTGAVRYNPANPESLIGTLGFGAERIQCSNSRMTRVLFGADWLKIDDFGRVQFSLKNVEAVERIDENTVRLTVSGTIMLHGLHVNQTVDIKVTYLRDAANRRGAKRFGDLLVLRSSFAVDRTKFGIKPDGPFDKVGRNIQIDVAIVGYSQ